MNTFRVIGTTDDVTTCDQCGRDDLKHTVVLAYLDADGNPEGLTYMGSDCGAKAAGWTQAKIKRDAKAADKAAKQAAWDEERRLADEKHAAFMAEYLTWLAATYGDSNEDVVVSRLRRSGAREASPFRLREACRESLKG